MHYLVYIDIYEVNIVDLYVSDSAMVFYFSQIFLHINCIILVFFKKQIVNTAALSTRVVRRGRQDHVYQNVTVIMVVSSARNSSVLI
jgi:hypothetical protein